VKKYKFEGTVQGIRIASGGIEINVFVPKSALETVPGSDTIGVVPAPGKAVALSFEGFEFKTETHDPWCDRNCDCGAAYEPPKAKVED